MNAAIFTAIVFPSEDYALQPSAKKSVSENNWQKTDLPEEGRRKY